MLAPNLLEIFINPLEKNEIPYMVTGSVAAIVYGEPRLTNDIDIVLHLKKDVIEKFESFFPLEEFYCPPLETLILESKREARAHFNLIHHQTGFKADCYLMGSEPLQIWGFKHRKRVELDANLSLWIAPPEYVILKKLMFYREGQSEKHIRDIANILAISSDEIDINFLKSQIGEHGLSNQWAQVKDYNLS